MSASQASGTERTESPDPSSHAATIYDDQPNENEWTDEQDDDDMDFEPTTDESEDVEFFDPEDEVEGEYHGVFLHANPRHHVGRQNPSIAFAY